MPNPPRNVVVQISCHNNMNDLGPCLRSVLESSDPGIALTVLLVDIGSQQDVTPWVKKNFPQVEVLRLDDNRGFSGGNNAGYERVRTKYPKTDYLVLLNADTEVKSGWLSTLGTFMDEHPTAGCAQAKLLLHDRTDTINTAGNRSHYLGFGMMSGYGEVDNGQYDQVRTIDFPSGAAVMIRMSLLKEFGLFDEMFYMYVEDADLGWKLRQAGYDCFCVPEAMVYHKYVPNAAMSFYEHLERNRWLLLLTYYKLGTLLVLAPALALMELGQLAYATLTGRLGAKLRSWHWFWHKAHCNHVLSRRRAASNRRAITDRRFTQYFSGIVELPDSQPPLLRYLGNPLLACYWLIMKKMICW